MKDGITEWFRRTASIANRDPVAIGRALVILVAGALIVLHGTVPEKFAVDAVSVSLLGVILIAVLVPLLESASFPGGGGLQFRRRLDELSDKSTEAAQEQSTQVGPHSEDDASESETKREAADSFDALVDEILKEASNSPRVGLMLLSAELERAVRNLLLATGWAENTRRTNSLRSGVERLVEAGALTRGAASALNLFSEVRNEIVHGHRTASDDEVLRALDAGITLLRAVRAIPHQRHFVAHELVEIYFDAEANKPDPSAMGLILESRSPEVGIKAKRIYPTTRTGYSVGDEVAWEWGPRNWSERWYRNPDSDQIEMAWSGSMEFVGRQIH